MIKDSGKSSIKPTTPNSPNASQTPANPPKAPRTTTSSSPVASRTINVGPSHIIDPVKLANNIDKFNKQEEDSNQKIFEIEKELEDIRERRREIRQELTSIKSRERSLRSKKNELEAKRKSATTALKEYETQKVVVRNTKHVEEDDDIVTSTSDLISHVESNLKLKSLCATISKKNGKVLLFRLIILIIFNFFRFVEGC